MLMHAVAFPGMSCLQPWLFYLAWEYPHVANFQSLISLMLVGTKDLLGIICFQSQLGMC